jgi:hypothetical protein
LDDGEAAGRHSSTEPQKRKQPDAALSLRMGPFASIARYLKVLRRNEQGRIAPRRGRVTA